MVRIYSLGILHSNCSLFVSGVVAGTRLLFHLAFLAGFGFVSSSSLSLFVISPDSIPSDSKDDSSGDTDLILQCLLLTKVMSLFLSLLGSCKEFIFSLVTVVPEMVACNGCGLFISMEVRGFGSEMAATVVTGMMGVTALV